MLQSVLLLILLNVVVIAAVVIVDARRGDVFERNKRSREFLDKSVIYNLT